MKIVVLDGYTLNPGNLDWKGLEALGELTVYDRTDACDIVSRIGDAECVLHQQDPPDGGDLRGLPVHPLRRRAGHRLQCRRRRRRQTPRHPRMQRSHLRHDRRGAVHHGAASGSLPSRRRAFRRRARGRVGCLPDFCFWNYPLIELAGKTMGIIGFGRIGAGRGQACAGVRHEGPRLRQSQAFRTGERHHALCGA